MPNGCGGGGGSGSGSGSGSGLLRFEGGGADMLPIIRREENAKC